MPVRPCKEPLEAPELFPVEVKRSSDFDQLVARFVDFHRRGLLGAVVRPLSHGGAGSSKRRLPAGAGQLVVAKVRSTRSRIIWPAPPHPIHSDAGDLRRRTRSGAHGRVSSAADIEALIDQGVESSPALLDRSPHSSQRRAVPHRARRAFVPRDIMLEWFAPDGRRSCCCSCAGRGCSSPGRCARTSSARRSST